MVKSIKVSVGVKRLLLASLLLISASSTTGCIRPYDTPEFVTIEASQTAFLIPLLGDTGEQASFESEALLAEAKVATKEIQCSTKLDSTRARISVSIISCKVLLL